MLLLPKQPAMSCRAKESGFIHGIKKRRYWSRRFN